MCLPLLLSCSCAFGHVSGDGSVTGWVLGDAQVSRCVVAADAQQVCTTIKGGNLSQEGASIFGGILTLVRLLIPGV